MNGSFLIGDDPGPTVLETIAPDDGMLVQGVAFEEARTHYFDVGRSALRCVRVALAAAGQSEIRTILDQAHLLSGSDPMAALEQIIAALRILGGERAVMHAMQVELAGKNVSVNLIQRKRGRLIGRTKLRRVLLVKCHNVS